MRAAGPPECAAYQSRRRQSIEGAPQRVGDLDVDHGHVGVNEFIVAGHHDQNIDVIRQGPRQSLHDAGGGDARGPEVVHRQAASGKAFFEQNPELLDKPYLGQWYADHGGAAVESDLQASVAAGHPADRSWFDRHPSTTRAAPSTSSRNSATASVAKASFLRVVIRRRWTIAAFSQSPPRSASRASGAVQAARLC